MSKINIDTISASAIKAQGTAKNTKAFIVGAIASYGHGKIKIHVAACLAFVHACDNHQADMLNLLHDGLEVNEQTALRSWVGLNSTYTVTDEAGTETTKQFIAFTKDKGFVVKKATEEHRVGKFDLKKLIAAGRFYSKMTAEKPEMDWAKVMAYLASVAKTAEKKAKAADSTLPAELKATLATLASQAEAFKTAH